MVLKFILFDMDGTITDTMRLQPYIIKTILLNNSLSFRETQRKMASIYYHNRFTWFKPETPVLFAKVFNISVFRMFFFLPILVLQYWRGLQQERIFADSASVLTSLKQKGYVIGLATNGTDFEVSLKIPTLIKLNLFDLKVTASDVNHKKPNPEMILKGMKKARVKPEETLYVGDTLVDFLASQNAHTTFALVTTGTFGPDVVTIGDKKPNHVFSSLTDLEKYIIISK